MLPRSVCLSLLALALVQVRASADETPKDYTQGCTASGCHNGFAKLPVVHSPAGGDACDTCHAAQAGTTAHRFKLTADGAALCIDCHDAFDGKHKHSPVADGQCLTCHDPHASAHAGLLRDTQAKVCGDCHDGVTENHKYLHGPVAAGACTSCHSAHASEQAHLLTGAIRDLCLKCHNAMQERLSGKAKLHAPVSGDCTDCHEPHGAGNAMLTQEASPALCFSCHDDVAEAMTRARFRHSAVSADIACAACHDAHIGKTGKLLRESEREICLGCHNKVIVAEGRTLPNLAEELGERPVQHGPVAGGECAICHRDVHGGSRYRLLAAAYPAAQYVAYAEKEYALCFECHDAEAFAAAQTDDATGFRNGRQNLHALHVARESKGRACRFCHEVHASKQPHLIAERVPFGAWQIPVGFEAATDGGSCAPGCHRPYRYDRNAPVANLVSPVAATGS